VGDERLPRRFPGGGAARDAAAGRLSAMAVEMGEDDGEGCGSGEIVGPLCLK
jgi:hypothetical protein